MAKRRCVCHVTKEKGTSDVFYKAPDGHYYKTEQIYLDHKKENESRLKVIESIYDILGWKTIQGMKDNAFYGKSEMLYRFGWSNVLAVVNKNKAELIQIMDRNDHKFKDEGARCVYLFAVIKRMCFGAEQNKNRIANVPKRKSNPEPKREFVEEREVLPDYYDEPDIMNLKPRYTKDISKWLD